ncbi:MAG: CoA transferase [Oscillospiraceae bacterium]|nr:CoA transferase [Oscillospiraceae bacterium]
MKPLEGVKVVDLTTFLAAPTAARVLGEWGADVIKVESPSGDPGRTQGAVFGMKYEDDENLGFDMSNMNKRFVTINLKHEKGMALFHKLLSDADVFVTNVRTKSLKKMGLDYDSLKAQYPKLIFAHCLGYGENGPEKDTAGFDVTCYMARGGVFGTTVNEGDAPMIPTNGFGDFQVAMCIASGICAALYNRNRTGSGDKITVSLHHAAAFMLSTAMVSAQYGNHYPKSRRKVICPTNNVFKTKDGKWIALCAPQYDRDYNKIMTLLGRADLVDNENYCNCDHLNELGLNSEVVDIMDEAMKQFTRDELIKLFKKNDLPCEACYEPLDMYEDEQVWANGIMTKLNCPSGQRNITTAPVKFQSLPDPSYKVTVAQGSDTEQVMAELGYTPEEIQAYLAEGAVVGKTALKK